MSNKVSELKALLTSKEQELAEVENAQRIADKELEKINKSIADLNNKLGNINADSVLEKVKLEKVIVSDIALYVRASDLTKITVETLEAKKAHIVKKIAEIEEDINWYEHFHPLIDKYSTEYGDYQKFLKTREHNQQELLRYKEKLQNLKDGGFAEFEADTISTLENSIIPALETQIALEFEPNYDDNSNFRKWLRARVKLEPFLTDLIASQDKYLVARKSLEGLQADLRTLGLEFSRIQSFRLLNKYESKFIHCTFAHFEA